MARGTDLREPKPTKTGSESMPNDQTIPVVRLTQWLEVWDDYDFDPSAQRRRPEPYIYLFSMSATRLRHLSDVYRRERDTEHAEGIQRAREDSRTDRIRRYIKAGYPFGDLRENLHEANLHLRKPGWLPTAIVVNILTQSDQRRGNSIAEDHMACLTERDGHHHIELPERDTFGPTDLRPFEVIDGQHRLWAFDHDGDLLDSDVGDDLSDFEVPVVAFRGLDVAWQAYLFWSINISPKRINPSHAFDLYPLLRTQDWLEHTGEIAVYREARAQEITEWLYRHETSPWYDRISMLQRRGEPNVSQAAWVRSLIGSFFGTGRGKGRRGLFQCAYDEEDSTLDWQRVQQIAFILEFWTRLKAAVDEGEHHWMGLYREDTRDPFTDKSSMLNQDMGVRAIHAVLNDIFFSRAADWRLHLWRFETDDKTSTADFDIDQAVSSLRANEVHEYLDYAAAAISGFDWRSLDGPAVRSSEHEMTKRAYRGSGGYTLLTVNVLQFVSENAQPPVAEAACAILPATQIS